MHQPQFWLSGQERNDFLKDGQAEKETIFLAAYEEFLAILCSTRESRGAPYQPAFDPSQIIQSALEKKSHWYFAAASHPRNAYSFLANYIQPLFAPSHGEPDGAATFQDTFVPYYAKDALKLVECKVEDKAKIR